uniref:Integrin beta-1-binding protein 1 n=1 Tax=Sinocyclocheilus rhinocerous TaxID=307959 RepID=A0A673LYJ0_9TELE
MFRKVKKRHSSSSSQSSEISTKSKVGLPAVIEYTLPDLVEPSGNAVSDACAEFRVKYVGAIEKLQFEMSKTLQEPLDLINYIDAAQQDGKLPFVPGNEEMILGVSKYGVKVASLDQCDVLHRHPLYLIVRMLCYDDGLGAGKNLLALKTTDAEQQECSIWVYQCSSAEQAQAICKVLSTSFDCALASEKS